MTDPSSQLKLNKGAERRIKSGHLWVFSNEVDVAATPLKAMQPGQAVTVVSNKGDFLGVGYVNPHSLICARICSFSEQDSFGAELIGRRLNTALELRNKLFEAPYYRLVHGEGDGLPGLVVDRFGDTLVVQMTTAGIEGQADAIVSLLSKIDGISHILLRNDGAVRDFEQLERYQKNALGTPADELDIVENNLHYKVSATEGQKTGWFYDHRENRALMSRYCDGLRVLDVFSYAGAWGINAMAGGAAEVVSIDSSQRATDQVSANAAANGFVGKVSVITGDAIETLKRLNNEGQKFDLVIADPPAFIKRKKDFKAGLQHYALLNRLAARVLVTGGYLASASCSQSMGVQDLSGAARSGVRRSGRDLQFLHELTQGPDHPWLHGMPESRYLKGVIGRVI